MVREPDQVDDYCIDRDLSLLKKLTLVIPTYNRNFYLSRCLWYHAHFPFGQIIIADSSPEEKKVVNRETVAKIKEKYDVNILYLEYQPETEKYGGDIYQKWGDAVQHVETDYSIVCIDKAFLEPIWLTKSIHYLDENRDTVSVYGNCDYVRANTCVFSDEKYIFNNDQYTIPLPDNYYIINQLARDRISAIFKEEIPWKNNQLFAITHAENHKSLYNLLIEYSIEDIRYGELVIGQLGNIYGKIKYIDGVMCIRDIVVFSSNRIEKRKMNPESSDSRYPYFIALSKISPLFHEKFIKCINTELKKLGEDTVDIGATDIFRFDNVEGSDTAMLIKKHYRTYNFWFTYVPPKLQNLIISILSFLAPRLPKPNKLYFSKSNIYYELIADIIKKWDNNQIEDSPII